MRIVPRSLRKFIQKRIDLWFIYGAREVIQRRSATPEDRYLSLGHLDYLAYRSLLMKSSARAWPSINYARMRNVLPNSGPVPMERDFRSARELIAAFPDARKRSQAIEGFEGFAPDDAIYDDTEQSWELWSNAGLAGTIASFGYRHYANPSVLELGCGPAHLFFFLRRYGVCNYVGVDGNPLMLKLNPALKGYEQHFLTQNLQEEIALRQNDEPLKFDIVCSFEVLEHIREERIERFIRTMRNHMHAGSVAFCTASLQSGMDVHVLVRDRGWWLERFTSLGLRPRKDQADICGQLGRHHPFNWTPENTNIFALQAVSGCR